MDNALDKARYEFYLKHPESILRSEPWIVIAVCLRCKGDNDPRRTAFLKTVESPLFDSTRDQCKVCGVRKMRPFKPLPHEMWRKRFNVLTEKSRFMREPEVTGFWEYEKIPDIEA